MPIVKRENQIPNFVCSNYIPTFFYLHNFHLSYNIYIYIYMIKKGKRKYFPLVCLETKRKRENK